VRGRRTVAHAGEERMSLGPGQRLEREARALGGLGGSLDGHGRPESSACVA
jgi:hypothetical protein